MVENHRNAHEKFGVNSGTLEYLVYVGTVTVQLASEPADTSLLPFKFSLDELSDIDVWPYGVVLFFHIYIMCMVNVQHPCMSLFHKAEEIVI